jgi:thioredoxin 1
MKLQKYDEKTFQKVLKENKIVVIKFSTKWCGPCKELIKQMLKDKTDILIIEVDAEEYEEFSSKHDIRCYPTILFYKNEIQQKEKVTGCRLEEIINTYNILNK